MGLGSPILIVVSVAIGYVFFMQFIDHRIQINPTIIILLSLIKSILISKAVLVSLRKVVVLCQSIFQLLTLFGALILLTIFSFATDYTCLIHNYKNSISGFSESSSYIQSLFDGLYFSIVTFSTVGYGDMVPLTRAAKTIVVIEMSMSFLIIFFALANVSKSHINE